MLANKASCRDSIVLFSYNFPEPADASFKPRAKPVVVTDRQRKINRDETMKPVIAIDELEERYLRRKSRSGNEKAASSTSEEIEVSVDKFVRSISDHLSAYISRMDQVQELLPKNGSTRADCGEVFNVVYSRDTRRVKFTLKLEDSNGTNGRLFGESY